jgi:hypothetical protein
VIWALKIVHWLKGPILLRTMLPAAQPEPHLGLHSANKILICAYHEPATQEEPGKITLLHGNKFFCSGSHI